MKRNKIIILLSIFLLFCNCNSQNQSAKKQQYIDERDAAFKEYLVKKNIPFKELSNAIFDNYYSDFTSDKLKQKLESNPYLKVNKVYVYYRTPTSVEFSIYSDKGTFCLNTFDLDIDGKILSFPENGVIKILEPIKVEDFGDFEIVDNVIKTRKRRISPFKETYYYVNGTIKNDTIHYTEKYIGREKKFEKKLLSKTLKSDIKEIYQPNLKAVQYNVGRFLVSYEVTGEFNIEK